MTEADTSNSADATGIPSRTVVLTGFMGTGKSTVGRSLAARIDFDFIDTDALIEERFGPIPVIFKERGETEFRNIERDIAAELAERPHLVVATGGRMMVDESNVATLGTAGRVFCLRASVDTIIERVTDENGFTDRPLLAGVDVRKTIVGLLADRATAYGRFEQVDTDGRTPHEIASDIAARLFSTHP